MDPIEQPEVNIAAEKKLRREIANCNERRRMQSINTGFKELRALLPVTDCDKLSKAAILHHTSDMIKDLQREREHLNAQNARLRTMLNDNRNTRIEHLMLRGHAPRSSSLPSSEHDEDDDEDEEEPRLCIDEQLYDDDDRQKKNEEKDEVTGPRKAHVKLTRQEFHSTSASKRRKCDTESSDEGIGLEPAQKMTLMRETLKLNLSKSSSNVEDISLPVDINSNQRLQENSPSSSIASLTSLASPVQTPPPRRFSVESETSRSYLNHLVQAICQVEGDDLSSLTGDSRTFTRPGVIVEHVS